MDDCAEAAAYANSMDIGVWCLVAGVVVLMALQLPHVRRWWRRVRRGKEPRRRRPTLMAQRELERQLLLARMANDDLRGKLELRTAALASRGTSAASALVCRNEGAPPGGPPAAEDVQLSLSAR